MMLLVAGPQGLFMHSVGLQPRARTLPTLMKLGYDVDRFAGRYALGKNLPAVESKSGFTLARSGAGEVRLLGGACSEVLGGANLANLLHKGYELEVSAMEAMRKDEPAAALSVHTSAGVPPELNEFLTAEPHIPTKTGDWCVNLQAEGASAVHAAIDMALLDGGECPSACAGCPTWQAHPRTRVLSLERPRARTLRPALRPPCH